MNKTSLFQTLYEDPNDEEKKIYVEKKGKLDTIVQDDKLVKTFLVWIDDNHTNNEKFIEQATKRGITVLKFSTTYQALRDLDKMKSSLAKSQGNVHFRIITDRTRPFEDENGKIYKPLDKDGKPIMIEIKKGQFVEMLNEKAGQEFIQRAVDLKVPVQYIKVFHGGITDDEIRCFSLFYPEYLTLANDYFQGSLKYLKSDKCKYHPLMDQKLLKTTDFDANLRREYTEQISSILKDKIKTSSTFSFELKGIKQIHNPELLNAHRKLYYQYADALFQEKGSSYIPKHLLCFHGTAESNLQSFFDKGFDRGKIGSTDAGYYGKGFYVTTYFQYALHYVNGWQGVDSITGFKVMPVGEERSIIGGFTIPGKLFKVTDMKMFSKKLVDGYNSHFTRVNVKKNAANILDFLPVIDKSDELADEIVLFEPAQFLPYFEITVKRIK